MTKIYKLSYPAKEIENKLGIIIPKSEVETLIETKTDKYLDNTEASTLVSGMISDRPTKQQVTNEVDTKVNTRTTPDQVNTLIDNKLKLRTKTTQDWNSDTNIIPLGELVLELYTDDNGKKQYLMKIGDGEKKFSQLPYFHQYHFQTLDHAPSSSETNKHTITFVIDA